MNRKFQSKNTQAVHRAKQYISKELQSQREILSVIKINHHYGNLIYIYIYIYIELLLHPPIQSSIGNLVEE